MFQSVWNILRWEVHHRWRFCRFRFFNYDHIRAWLAGLNHDDLFKTVPVHRSTGTIPGQLVSPGTRKGGHIPRQETKETFLSIQGSYKMAICGISTRGDIFLDKKQRRPSSASRGHIRWPSAVAFPQVVVAREPVGVSRRGDGKLSNRLAYQDEEMASLQTQRLSSTTRVTFFAISYPIDSVRLKSN